MRDIVRSASVLLRVTGVLAAAFVFAAGTAGARAALKPASPVPLDFAIYHPPAGSAGAHTAEEPSIGSDWRTAAAMYQSLLTTYRVTFATSGIPPAATWTDVSAPLTSQQTLDPILFTDPTTGRTFVSQLAGECSLSEFSDDDGSSWTPSEGCGPPSGVDHQSIGGGPFAPPLTGGSPAYPDAVYYCSQAVATAFCALSADGGLTYDAGVPIYTLAQCGGLHGHIRVAPDGTAVMPNQNCDSSPSTSGATGNFAHQATIVSTDNGGTWAVHTIPDSVSTLRSDPSVSADAANKLYFGYEDGVYKGGDVNGEQVGGRAMIATSSDHGATWSRSVDVGAPQGIQNVTFPEVITGSAGRAAYAFLGSTTAGDPENTTFKGLWYLYVAVTNNGGSSWTLENLTPGDPVERGCIYLAGTGDCSNPAKRNLYDFMDITADNHGRILVGYSDGCTGTCVTDQSQPCSDAACDTGPTASTDHYASIARETCGIGLLAQYAASVACAPAAAGPGGGRRTSRASTRSDRASPISAGAPARWRH
jgi:hypothetical protein